MTYRKKLIEVALPLQAINEASAREKSIRHGHPSTLHLWWARRPLAAARAVIFAQMVDDPSSCSDLFPTEKKQEKERQRLFRIIEELVKWESTTNEKVLQAARDEIWASWRRACADNADHPRAKELFDRHKLPAFHDPFAGGGSLPLEAQRLGLEAYASDLNPVAVLINKAMIEIPPKFAGRPPVNPEARRNPGLIAREWRGAQGLAEDVRYYGQWMRDEAEKRVGDLYPTARLPKQHGGGEATVIAWIWARTTTCPNPACGAELPLLNAFTLSKRKGKEAWLEPRVSRREKRVTFGIGQGPGAPTEATVSRTGARCLVCGDPVPLAHVRSTGKAGRMGTQLLCVVADGPGGRVYLPAAEAHEEAARVPAPRGVPETDLPEEALGFRVQGYGLTKHRHLFTNRQLRALVTMSDLVSGAAERAVRDGASPEYGAALTVYLTLAIGRLANRCSTQCFWNPIGEKIEQVFARNALPMVWVFAEANPFSDSSGNFLGQVDYLAGALADVPAGPPAFVRQADAAASPLERPMVIVSDPPYYDNVPYADLSDFFYVWHRRSAAAVLPELFGTVLVPKAEELIAEPARQGGWEAAAAFFEAGLARVFALWRQSQLDGYPMALFYAFKQSEDAEAGGGHLSTGWERMLQGLVDAGFTVSGTWPMRTEKAGGIRDLGRNALASSIILACRPRPADAPTATRRELLTALKSELPLALAHLQRGNIAPVDLAQAAIGPGMAVYTRYSRVLDAAGKPLTVRDALTLINQTLDEALAEQEGDFDADTRWALAWFEQSGFEEGEYGVAETLSKAKNTSVAGMVEAGILKSGRGKVRLLKPDELPPTWDPATDARLTTWEMVHHLIRVLEAGGEGAASQLVAKLGGKAEMARELAYRLYNLCERKKRAPEALSYNALVQSWLEITRLAQGKTASRPAQGGLFGEE